MTTKVVLSGVFLLVSVSSLGMQASAWWRLHRQGATGARVAAEAHHGLVRTATCRVIAAALYVGLGVTSVLAKTSPGLALGIFTVVQVLWQGNALADLRLRRRIARAPRPTPPAAPAPRPAQPVRPDKEAPDGTRP